MRRLLASALLLTAGMAGAVRAEPTMLPAGAPRLDVLQAYARTDAYKRLLTQALARVPASVVPRCPKLVVEDGVMIQQQPLQLAPDKVAVGGAWRHSQPVRGCGNDTVVNFFFYGSPDRRVLTVVGVPGTTRTDLMQQRNARTYVLVALEGVAPACRQFDTVNTVFEGWGNKTPELKDPGPAEELRPWWESWVMAGCGKRYSVPLNFIPNRLGTQIVQPGGIEPR